MGATIAIPVSSAGEENLLCLANDPYAGEQVLVQTFATAVLLGLERVDGSTFGSRLRRGVRRRDARRPVAEHVRDGKPRSSTTRWAFRPGSTRTPDVSPPDGTHNEINTRAELIQYDPVLADLVAESMPDDDWRPMCP